MHCKDKFFRNKMNFDFVLFIYPCNGICENGCLCISNFSNVELDVILDYVICEMSRIYQIGKVSHRPSFNWIETWNHTTWLHDE